MDTRIEALFEQAGCEGQLCVQSLDGAGEVAVHPDQQVVSASVVKVPIALEAETQFADGRLDPAGVFRSDLGQRLGLRRAALTSPGRQHAG